MLPTVFVSHGSPMLLLRPGIAGKNLTELGKRIGKPKAILVLSGHWLTQDIRISRASEQGTIHDFHGFPEELYRITYPVPGAPDVASEALSFLQSAGFETEFEEERGLDHGAWVPLRFMFPERDVPVFQISIPVSVSFEHLIIMGQALSPLREQGVLIMGSGSLTHNFRDMDRSLNTDEGLALPYVNEFAIWVENKLQQHDLVGLSRYHEIAAGQRAHPTDDHFVPMLVAAGAARPKFATERIHSGTYWASVNMDCFVMQ